MSNFQRARGQGQVDEPQAEPEAAHATAEETGATLLNILLEDAVSSPALATRIDGVVLGRVATVDPSGAVRVTFTGSPEEGFAARVTTPLTKDDEGREVALVFEQGDPNRPIVMGKVVSALAAAQAEAIADKRRVEINADEEIVLRCGESSITLTRAGKIILRGAYLLSRSSGVNRIVGGSVEIN